MKISMIVLASFLAIVVPQQEALAKCLYEISGQVTVNNPYTGRNEALAGVPVQVGGNTHGKWKYWQGEQVFSDDNGYFSITKKKSCVKRKLRLRFKLKNNRIRVHANKLYIKNKWIKHTISSVKTQNRTFEVHATTDEASSNMTKRAGIFSIIDMANKTVDQYGEGLENPRKIDVIYPTKSMDISGALATNNTIYFTDQSVVADIVDDEGNILERNQHFIFEIDAYTILHEYGHIWHFAHRDGYNNCSPGQEGHQENACPTAAFTEGFAEFFACQISIEKEFPMGDTLRNGCYAFFEDRHLMPTLDEMQRIDIFVAAILLNFSEGFAFDNYITDLCSYDFPKFSFKEVLSVFLPNPDSGWPNYLSSNGEEDGLLVFLERARDIIPGFTSDYHELFIQMHDKNSFNTLSGLCSGNDFSPLDPEDHPHDGTVGLPLDSPTEDSDEADDDEELIISDIPDTSLNDDGDDDSTTDTDEDSDEDSNDDSEHTDEIVNTPDDVDIDTPPSSPEGDGIIPTAGETPTPTGEGADTTPFISSESGSGCSLTNRSNAKSGMGPTSIFTILLLGLYLIHLRTRFQKSKLTSPC